MTTREAALALVAELRAAGVLFVVELGTLRLTYRDPAGAVTPEVLASWQALAVDVRAVLFGELADVANMAALAGLPADLTASVRPAGRRRGSSPAELPPRRDTGADRLASVALRLRADAEAAAAAYSPPLPYWRCPCGASSVRGVCWNCGRERPAGAVLTYPPAADDLNTLSKRTDAA